MPCPAAYGELTRLPQGCINGLPGGGVLWAPSAYSKNEADLKRSAKLITGLRLNLDRLRGDITKSVNEHAKEIQNLQDDLARDVEAIKKESSSASIRAFIYGVSAGVVLSAIGVIVL
jgi:hypothetical protein